MKKKKISRNFRFENYHEITNVWCDNIFKRM